MLSYELSARAKDGAFIPAIAFETRGQEVKGVVVICHGFGEHSRSYKELTERQTQVGYASVIYDQRGHGKLSDSPKKREKLRGVIPSYQSFLDDLGEVVAAARKRYPGAPLALYGHSMGGNIVVNYLLRRSQSFSCAILESPWLGLHEKTSAPPAGLMKVLGALLPNVPLPRKLTKLSPSELTGDEERQKAVRSDSLYHNRMTLRLFSAIGGGCAYALNNASRLSIPTFMAFASEEKIVSNDAIRAFVRANETYVHSKEYESRHAIHSDKSRDAFYRDVIDFLDAHGSAGLA